MNKIIRVTENELNSIIKNIVEDVEPEEYTEIESKKFYDILENLAFNMKVATRTRKGNKLKIIGPLDLSKKPITTLGNLGWITGSLNLSDTPLESIGALEYVGGDLTVSNTKLNDLGNLVQVTNRLDISYTNIEDISNIKYKYIRDFDSKYDKKLKRIELNKIKNEAIKRQENNEWDLENLEGGVSDEALMANAIYTWLKDEDKLDLLSINEEDELGIYNLIPTNNKHYEMHVFRTLNDYFQGVEFAIGDEDEISDSAKEYAKDSIDDIGIEGFPTWMLENCISTQDVEDLAEEIYNHDVYESPESYFDIDDNLNQDEIDELDDRIGELVDEQNDLDDQSEDYDDEYDRLESEINTLRDSLERLEEEGKEPTEEMKEDKIKELVKEASDDPLSFLNNFGYEYKNYIDKNKLAEDWVDADGYGIMSGYDGQVNTIYIGNTLFHIIRIE
jgi:TolA-binding protein